MTVAPQVSIDPGENYPLKTAMYDAQASAATYYANTALNSDMDQLGMSVRTFLTATQTVNDLLTNVVGDRATYQSIMSSGNDRGQGFIQAVKYARNVSQHVAHVIRPSDRHAIIGGLHGLRIYASRDDIPEAAHADLRPATQSLRRYYDEHLKGKDVITTMLEVLRFFWEVAPDIVHRDERGEWTRFPLMDQPGVGIRLHPEEPADEAEAWSWLRDRLPGGDVRVICGQITAETNTYLVGFTFVGHLAFAPFVETADQVQKDMAAGYPYVIGDISSNTADCRRDFPGVMGSVLYSNNRISSWTSPAPNGLWNHDWLHEGEQEMEQIWSRMIEMERSAISSFLVYRARRLNALATN